MSASIPNAQPPQYPPSPLVFHPYAHDTPPNASVPPPALSARRVNRLNPVVQFPTFLYASEPPPPTARNKQRVRPTAAQLAELKALYAETAHPARDVREALGRRIGMRYPSITNWFQNQRSTAKRRVVATPVENQSQSQSQNPSQSRSRSRSRSSMPSPQRVPSPSPHEEDDSHASGDDEEIDQVRGRSLIREPAVEPPREHSLPRVRARIDPVKDIIDAQAAARLNQLALPLSGSSIVPSAFASDREARSNTTSPPLNIALPPAPRTDISTNSSTATSTSTSVSRAHTPPLLSSFQVSRAPSPEPMDDFIDEVPRGTRSRPTPQQLAALRALHTVTSSPTIEERTKLGRDIGMELGKVTNWFRNLRQTARKKERRAVATVGNALHPSSKRGRDSSFPDREYKRARMAFEEDDDDDMSVSHANSGSFDTRSTVGSVDHDMDYEFDQPQHPYHHGEYYEGHEHDAPRYTLRPIYQHQDDEFTFRDDDAHRRSERIQRPAQQQEPEQEPEQEQEQEQDREREAGTESDSTHEAVTPEPQSTRTATAPPPPPPTPASTSTTPFDEDRHAQNRQLRSQSQLPSQSKHTKQPTQLPSHSKHLKQPSLDDAMLLLEFHSARV